MQATKLYERACRSIVNLPVGAVGKPVYLALNRLKYAEKKLRKFAPENANDLMMIISIQVCNEVR